MRAYAYPSWQEKVISGAYACGMHLLFVVLLVFGVTWQTRVEPQANSVDLWANLPSSQPPLKVRPPPPKVELPPPPKVELPPPKVEPPPPELKLEVKPPEPPPVKPVAKPEIAKPDIAMKEKAMKEKAEKEKAEKEKAAQEKAAQEKAAKEKAAKEKAAKEKAAKEKAAKEKAAQEKAEKEKAEKEEVEKERRALEQQDAQRRVAEQQAAAQARLRSEYIGRIRAKIRFLVVMPPNIQGNPEAEFDVVLLPGGDVLSAKLKRASGNAAYDRAVETAILKASPLPLPPDPALFRDFRELNLKFRPKE